MAARQAVVPAWRLALAKWAYNRSYFNQLGLMRDDTLMETEEVKEAIRRLPNDLYDQRQFRLSRALQLSNQKVVLPKEEWTTFEQDVEYLKPYLEEVMRERQERENWAKK